MDFAIRNLSVLAYAQGFTLWHYKAAGLKLDSTQRPGFFNSAADMITSGDMMLVSAADGGCVLFVAQASETAGIATAKLA
jgi:hypothetical protein